MILDRIPQLGLAQWWLTAGAVFQNVWNAVTRRPPGWGIKDDDVFYFDDQDLSYEAEDRFGVPCRPFVSVCDGIDHFAMTSCRVAVSRDRTAYRVHAPHGTADLFALHLRPNPVLAPRAVYETKVAEYRERWPELTADPWPVSP